MRKYNWKKILINAVWILAGAGTIVLLGAAMQKKSRKDCTDIKIEITGAEQHMFIDEKDVLNMLHAGGKVEGNTIGLLNLRQMETVVEKNPWVKNAEMFIDNNQVLQVRIEERQPVARVFTQEGSSFYLDSAALRLPLSDKISARVPMFTGFPSNRKILSKPDSALLNDVVKIGRYILADSFWMAQTAQIAIMPDAGFEMIPVVGDHTVLLGNADDIPGKFDRLYTFYKKAWLQNGINTYETLDLKYNNQVVATRKGTAKARIDSMQVHQLIQSIIAASSVMRADSSEAKPVIKKEMVPGKKDSLLQKPVVKLPAKTNSPVGINNKTNIKSLSKKKDTAVKKQTKKKTAEKGKQPKAVMGKQNQ
jgi:cell division protein FtsQ